MTTKSIRFILPLLFFCLPLHSQFEKGLNYKIETGINFGTGEHTPFWLTANKQGLSSVQKNNAYLRAGIYRPMEKDKRFSYAYGLDMVGAYRFPASFIQQAYVDFKYRFLELSLGSKERYGELKNNQLSSGGLTFSTNSRPIPQARISIEDYVIIPGTKKLFALKGHLAYGMFTDDKWQLDFIKSGNKHTKNALYHSKALFGRIGNEEVFPLVFEGGLEMAAQFGGKSIVNDVVINMPNSIKDFFKVFIPQGGDSDTPMGEQVNVYGNHLGSWSFSLSYHFNNWKVRGYYEHFFEDHSMMFGEYGWKDCLAGVEFTLPKNPIVSSFVYEYLGTKDQAGPAYHDTTESIPDQISAIDSYYNHGIYTGWQHWGQAIGNPLFI
ncbi:MAG: capsule assembly Wzi family protein, partial [Bacteroides sp.]